ncbi:MAG TPA: ComEC/Rec2 family competence protein [Candidatus Absconditabacterales bacterium]|nr:ComEC/Rec2 family competence protein [Candidatus Absconditabacterales bacterium]
MFIISFAIFILVLSTFENIFLAFLVLGLVLVAYFLIGKKIGGIKIRRGLGMIILAFVLSLVSIYVKNYSYNTKTDIAYHNTGLISQNLNAPQSNYFVGTGKISDVYSYQRYIFEDNGGREYFLKSENKYKIGDQIWLNAYFSPAYTGSKDIFDIKGQWKELGGKGMFEGIFHYEFDYPKRLMMKGFYGNLYEQNAVNITNKIPLEKGEEGGSVGIIKNPPTPFYKGGGSNIGFLQKIRRGLQEKVIKAYGENKESGLILGMLVGDKSQIPPDEYDGFINSGLVHIIAVSGGNIIMIVVFLGAVLFFLPFYVRNAVILGTIILYAMICGMDSSVFRATIMGGLGMLALFWGREINIWRAMGIAFVSMLLINPYFLAYDVGFLLSFSAIVGIVYFGKWIDNAQNSSLLKGGAQRAVGFKTPTRSGSLPLKKGTNKRLKKISKEYVTPTIGATLGVLPVMLFFMGKTNLVGIFANFLVVPIVAIVMIYGFVSTILYTILPWSIFLRPEKILIKYIYIISDLAEKFGIYIQAEGAWVKYVLMVLFVLWLIFERLGKKD